MQQTVGGVKCKNNTMRNKRTADVFHNNHDVLGGSESDNLWFSTTARRLDPKYNNAHASTSVHTM